MILMRKLQNVIESADGHLKALEIKWKVQKIKVPDAWEKTYPEAEFKCINPATYLDWIR